jgi:hypothetical protein
LENPPAFLDVTGTLGLFARSRRLAQKEFIRFVDAADPDHEDIPLVRIAGA